MSVEFRLPSLGADMEGATLVEWKVAAGDVIKRGDIIAVVETDKGAIDLEIFDPGKIEKLLVSPGARMRVGDAIALLDSGPIAAPTAAAPPVTPTSATPIVAAAPVATPAAAPSRVKISPAARARAAALHLAPAALSGGGPGGVITLEDVERAATSQGAPAAPTTAASATAAPAAGDLRSVIAAAMARSKREIPHYYLSVAVDYAAARAWLNAYNARVAVSLRILPVVPLLRAVAVAATQIEGFSGHYEDGAFRTSAAVHLGVAIALRGGGLVAPAILDAGGKSPAALMQALGDLVNRARSGRLRSSELSAGTLTVTSLGDQAVDSVTPIIYPPQVAIIGAGAIAERPWIVDGRIEARPLLTLTLAADHRVGDGRAGARFLARVRELLQTPEKL